MSSGIEVANEALMLLGARRIVSFEDGITESNLMKDLWPIARDNVLRMYPWNCATVRQELVKLTDDPINQFNNAFQLPSDPYLLRLLNLYSGDFNIKANTVGGPRSSADAWYVRIEPEVSYRIEGRTVLTNEENIFAQYVGRIETGIMDSLLRTAIAGYMAREAAYALTQSSGTVTQMAQLFMAKLDEARITDRLEEPHERLTATRLSQVRV